MAEIPNPLTRDWLLANAGTNFVSHINGVKAHIFHRRIVAREGGAGIGIGFVDTSYKNHKSNGDNAGRVIRLWYIDAVDDDFPTLDAAIAAFNLHRDDAAVAA